jgi:hypothetical protein
MGDVAFDVMSDASSGSGQQLVCGIVPVTDKRQVPGLVEVAVAELPVHQMVFVIESAGADSEAVATHLFAGLALIRVPAVGKVSGTDHIGLDLAISKTLLQVG